MGVFKPVIYLPDNHGDSEKDYILLHEQTHIKHGDSLTKIIGVLAVAVHWFNPLVWIAFSLFEQDIEMRCDEKTIDHMETNTKKAYSMLLVSFARRAKPTQ